VEAKGLFQFKHFHMVIKKQTFYWQRLLFTQTLAQIKIQAIGKIAKKNCLFKSFG